MPLRGSIDMASKQCIFFREVSISALSRVFMFAEMYNLYKQKKADEVDLFGSEAKQFFEVSQGTKVGKIERYFNCNNPEWNKSLKN